MDSSSSDSEEDTRYDKKNQDRTHRVFDYRELLVGAEGRFESVSAFTRILKRQGFVRIILPEVPQQQASSCVLADAAVWHRKCFRPTTKSSGSPTPSSIWTKKRR